MYKILIQVTPLLSYKINNNQEIKETINSINNDFPPNSKMYSIDIETMYNNIPTDESAIKIITKYLAENINKIDLYGFKIHHIIKLLKFLLNNTYFTYHESFYTHSIGLGTGYKSSEAYAEIIVDHTYKEALNKTTPNPLGLSLYVDDAWLLWTGTKQEFLQFLENLNSIWPSLNFTYEEEENGLITFLDLKISRNINSLSYSFHQKETHSGTYLNFNSHCSMSIKTNIIFTEAKRIIKNHSNQENIWPDLEKLKDHLLNSEYPENIINKFIIKAINSHDNPNKIKKAYDFILSIPYINEPFTRQIKNTIKKSHINARVVVTSGKTLKMAMKTKSQPKKCECILCKNNLPCHSKNIVYKMTCKNCKTTNSNYIGATNRKITKRLEEHEHSIRKFNNRTTTGEHMLLKHKRNKPRKQLPNKINFQNLFKHYKVEILKQCKDPLETYIVEQMNIKKKDSATLNNYQTNGFIKKVDTLGVVLS